MILEKIIRKSICDRENSFFFINQINLMLCIAWKNLIISLERKTNTDLQCKLLLISFFEKCKSIKIRREKKINKRIIQFVLRTFISIQIFLKLFSTVDNRSRQKW
jgi:hypothetical protein